jgi:hypothetical protein
MSEIQLKQKIIQKLEGMGQDTLVFLDRFIDNLDVYLRSQRSSEPEAPVDNEQRRVLIRNLRGMAVRSTLSSDDFAGRKQDEIDWEGRNL